MKLDRNEIQDKILIELKKRIKKDVDINSELRGLGIDSIDLLDFVLQIESQFDIKIDDEELLNLDKVVDVVNSIEKALNK